MGRPPRGGADRACNVPPPCRSSRSPYPFYNLVFFIVISSVLLQGTTIPLVSRLLGVDEPGSKSVTHNVEFEFPYDENSEMIEIAIPERSGAVGRQVVELGLPESALIMLIKRSDVSVVPRGSTILEAGDRLLILAERYDKEAVNSILVSGS
jgi:cell volume regulation protein A